MEHSVDVPFRDPARSIDTLNRLSPELPPGIRTRIQVLLAPSADPDGAVHWLESLRQRQPGPFLRLTHSTAGLQHLVTVFSHSRFLAEEILKHPEWIEALPASGDLGRVLSADELVERLEACLGGANGPPATVKLAEFRRREILRILLHDALGLGTLSEAAEELSNLADAVLEVTYRRVRADLVRRYGVPRPADETGESRECGCSILALGKLGGRELNYSSDIDLMFVYSAAGETAGPNPVTNREFFQKAASQCTKLLSTYTAEGMCYRVDLRLRPDGRLGEVAISLGGARAYYQNRARDWELQMLIKARVAAGEREPGRALLEFVQPLIYSTTLDFSAVEAVSVTRERISEKLAGRRAAQSGHDVKLARGGIRDIEFLVQCLQRLHGGREQWVRHGGTLMALARLRDKELLSPKEYSRLASAYEFLRYLEHRLQFDEDRQTHLLPEDTAARELIAARMPATHMEGEATAENLLRKLNQHLEGVQEIYERVIHAQRPIYYSTAQGAPPDAAAGPEPPPAADPQASNLVRFLDQKAPRLAALLARGALRRGAQRFEHYLEKVLPNATWVEWLDSDAVLAGYVLDLFEHSPYFADQLIRSPELLEEIRGLREHPEEEASYAALASAFGEAADLRRFFRRQMLRIQTESICLRRPIFLTLERTSALADAAIAAAYRMALAQVAVSRPPASADYAPRDQMMVIALGRLGMREFDLASDADLVFVLPDRDGAEHLFWTRVAERMIALLTAYTGEGVMFAIDTRLRPNGREGALVQLEGAFKDYFAKGAETWEGITYMKSRAVAGDLDRATDFLHELQEVDWRRYGQSHRSRQSLRQMRARLEKEQGASNPLKAGPGGYYDIDFALMYLRLKGAGIFYKVLNTPERLDVIEKMGHLERADAVFLCDAATFHRAVDHGLRVSTGHTEGSLPATQAQLESLGELVTRWTPEHLHDQPLDVELEQIRARTREYFERLFGS